MTLRRFIILFFIIAQTNFLGFLDSETTTFIFPLKDYALLFVFIYTLTKIKVITKKEFKLIRAVLVIVLMSIIIILTMPLRGDISIIESFKTGRLFLSFIFSFIVYEEISNTGSNKFIYRIIMFLSVAYSLIVFINIINPSLTEKIFVGGGSLVKENSWGGDATRFVIKGNAGILFIHMGFLIKCFQYFSSNNKKKDSLFLLIFFFFAMLLQGWRAPLITTVLVVMVFYVTSDIKKRIIKILPFFIIATVMVIGIEHYYGQRIITSKFISVQEELSGEYEGTLQGRINRSKIYQVPMFLNSIWIGYGFVNKESDLSKKIGNTGERPYNLYDFDFGYFTLLNYFGLLGLSIFMYSIISIIKKGLKVIKTNNHSVWLKTMVSLLVALLASNFTFGAFVSNIGILPLSIIIALGQYEITQFNSNNVH